MPCNSDYLEASGFEVAMSRVTCLLEELNGKPLNRRYWDGYHPNVYNQDIDKKVADSLVALLCERLQKVDVTKYSLEMQMWWRDHQAADKARVKREQKEKKKDDERKAALSKLTPRERKLLGQE